MLRSSRDLVKSVIRGLFRFSEALKPVSQERIVGFLLAAEVNSGACCAIEFVKVRARNWQLMRYHVEGRSLGMIETDKGPNAVLTVTSRDLLVF